MASEKFGWGFLSTSEIGRKVKGALDASGVGRLVAVGSRNLENAQKWAQSVALPDDQITAYGSYDEVISDPQVKIVYIPLPSGLKKPWILKAINAGKHVLCEKPFATVQELQEYRDASKAKNVCFMDGTMFIHGPRYFEVLEVLNSGELGTVTNVGADLSFFWPADTSNVRLTKEVEPLGALGDVGWYVTRAILIAYNYELPEKVTASATFTPAGAVYSVQAILNYRGGRVALLNCGFNCATQQNWRITGTKKTLKIDDFVVPFAAEPIYYPKVEQKDYVEFNLRDNDGLLEVREVSFGKVKQEVRMIQNLDKMVKEGDLKKSEELLRQAILIQTVLEALYRAIHENVSITL